MTLNEHLKKVQNLPLAKRKIIFWFIIIISGLIVFSLYFLSVRHSLKTFSLEQSAGELKLPELKSEIKKEVEGLPQSGTGEEINKTRENIKELERLSKENAVQK